MDFPLQGPGGRTEFLKLDRAAHEAEKAWRQSAEV